MKKDPRKSDDGEGIRAIQTSPHCPSLTVDRDEGEAVQGDAEFTLLVLSSLTVDEEEGKQEITQTDPLLSVPPPYNRKRG